MTKPLLHQDNRLVEKEKAERESPKPVLKKAKSSEASPAPAKAKVTPKAPPTGSKLKKAAEAAAAKRGKAAKDNATPAGN